MFTKQNLQIAKFVSKDASRWSIQGIHVTPRETVVTDGHRLVRVKTVGETPDFKPFNIKASYALDAAKHAAKAEADITPHDDDTTKATIKVGSASFTVETHEGMFPQYDRVIPKDDDTWVSVTFDAKYMKELMDMHVSSGQYVTMRYKAGSPIIMETNGNQPIQSLLMPCNEGKVTQERY
jgi:DNA polymerase III sliding clamp (beta) subunit (PCNA family)